MSGGTPISTDVLQLTTGKLSSISDVATPTSMSVITNQIVYSVRFPFSSAAAMSQPSASASATQNLFSSATVMPNPSASASATQNLSCNFDSSFILFALPFSPRNEYHAHNFHDTEAKFITLAIASGTFFALNLFSDITEFSFELSSFHYSCRFTLFRVESLK